MKKLILIIALMVLTVPAMAQTPTPSVTPTTTPSTTPTPSVTPTPTVTPTPSVTPTTTPTVTPTPSVTPTPTVTPTTTPSTTPTVTPTAVPADVPSGSISWPYDISLRANFSELSTGPITDTKLINIRTGQTFTVPPGQRFYVTDINWSLQSAVIAQLEWDGASSDQLFDYVYFPFTGQGKVVTYIRPITSLDAGVSPVLTTDRSCTGWIYIGGYLE